MASHLIFKYLSHFKFSFVYGVRECSNFIDLHVAVQVSQHHLLKRTVFSPLYILASFVKDIIDRRCVGLFLGSLFCSLLIHMPVCVPVPNFFDYCSTAVLCEVWEGYGYTFVLFPQDCFGNSGSFVVPYKF